MEEAKKKKSQHKEQDQLTSASTFTIITPSASSTPSPIPGERFIEAGNFMEQLPSPKDERTVSTNPSSDVAIMGSSRKGMEKPGTSDTSGAMTNLNSLNTYMPHEQSFYFGGYDSTIGNWDEYSNYVNANNMQIIPPTMYSDNSSLLFHSGYGFDTQMAYGQFSPMVSPMSPIMLDAQLYSPHQIPMTPSYYPQPVSPGIPHVTSALPVSQTELMASGNSTQEAVGENVLWGQGQGYLLNFFSFGGGEPSGNNNLGLGNFQGEIGSGDPLSNQSNPVDMGRYFSPLTSAAIYSQPFGILGPYDHNIAQMSHQTAPHGFGLVSNSYRQQPQGGSYRNTSYSSGSVSNWEANRRNHLTPDKVGRWESDQDLTNISADSHGVSSDRHRGPRASKPKNRSSIEESSSSGIRNNGSSISGLQVDQYNQQDFVTNYVNAKFFVIKSFSEDNVHRSIKYNVWASTPLGNKKLDSAYREAKEVIGNCPVFLFFSVNASGQFCGVAEMVGPIDFESDADYWQQNRWSGQFPVKWHILKDVSNSQFRHILLENNDNKPVTHSRDSQEVKLKKGIEMLKIFKEYDTDTSILDDFNFYDEREKSLQEKKARDQAGSLKNSLVSLANDSINQLSNTLASTLPFKDVKDVPKAE